MSTYDLAERLEKRIAELEAEKATLAASLAEGTRDVRAAARAAGIVGAESMPIEGAADALRELAQSYREDYEEIRRVFHTACEKIRALEPYAGALRTAAERMVQTFRDWMAGCANETRWKEVEAAHINLRDALNSLEIRIVPDGALVDMPNGERMYALGPCAEEEEDGPPTITTFEVRAWLAPATSEPGERPQIERLIAHLDEIERGARCVHQVCKGQWIRVSERGPSTADIPFVYREFDDGLSNTCDTEGEFADLAEWLTQEGNHITAWMALPPLPDEPDDDPRHAIGPQQCQCEIYETCAVCSPSSRRNP